MKPRSLPVTVVVLSAFVLNACHSTRRIALPDSTPPPPTAGVFSELKAGDTVRVTIRTGEKATFTLAEVQAEGVVAQDGRRIPFADMWQLEKRHVSGTKTAILIAIPLLFLAFVAYVATHFGP